MRSRAFVIAVVLAAVPLVAPFAAAGHDYFCDTGTLNPICAPAHGPLEILYQCLIVQSGPICQLAVRTLQWVVCVATHPTAPEACDAP